MRDGDDRINAAVDVCGSTDEESQTNPARCSRKCGADCDGVLLTDNKEDRIRESGVRSVDGI